MNQIDKHHAEHFNHVRKLAGEVMNLSPGERLLLSSLVGQPPLDDLKMLLFVVDWNRKQNAIVDATMLTPRERLVVECIMAGAGPQAIADRMGISTHTCAKLRKQAIRKLAADNTADLVRLALEAGLKPDATLSAVE